MKNIIQKLTKTFLNRPFFSSPLISCKVQISMLFSLLIFDSLFKVLIIYSKSQSDSLPNKGYLMLYILKIFIFLFNILTCIFIRLPKEIKEIYIDVYLFLVKILTIVVFFEIDLVYYYKLVENLQILHEGLKLFFIEQSIGIFYKRLIFSLLSQWIIILYVLIRTINDISIEHITLILIGICWNALSKIHWDMNILNFNKKSENEEFKGIFDGDQCLDVFFEDFSKTSSNCISILNEHKKLLFSNKAMKKFFNEENETNIEKKLLNMEVRLKKKKKGIMEGVILNDSMDHNNILIEKNLSELSSIVSPEMNNCGKHKKEKFLEVFDMILEQIKKSHAKNTENIEQCCYKFLCFYHEKNTKKGSFSNIFLPCRIKGYFTFHFIKKVPYFSILLKNSQELSDKRNSKSRNLSEALRYMTDELSISCNTINILQQILEKHLDSQKKLSLLKPLSISLKLSMALQEEMQFMREMLLNKENSQIIEFNLKSFLLEVISLFSFQSDLKDNELMINYDNHLPINVQAEQHKIKIILISLLSIIIDFYYFLKYNLYN